MMKIFVILLMIISINVQAENDDTLICRQKVINFYNWYSEAINQIIEDVFLPSFVEDKNGNVTLDFTEYVNNLKRFGFTDKIVNNEINSYKPCIDNLQEITFKKFKEDFDDISNYEDIFCDFFNTHRWIKNMESFTGVEISKSIVNGKECKLYGRIYEGTEPYKFYYGDVVVTLIKFKDTWMIDEIKI